MSDRLALANAIEEAGIPRAKAERVASVIFDAIHDNVATKADVQASESAVLGQVATLRSDMAGQIAGLRSDVTGLRTHVAGESSGLRLEIALVEHRLLTRLGGLTVVLCGALFAALRYLPPHG
jgi:hypothetical protein